MADPIAWDTAERVAIRVAGREPLAESYHYASLEPDFHELTAEAEALVEAETGLKSLAGPARARVADRAGWIRANLPRSSACCGPSPTGSASRWATPRSPPSAARSPAPRWAPCSGWMSTRVLGQYDLLVIEDENPEDQDLVYYVGPQRPGPGEALRLPAPGVPPVAGPPRGHPPHAVHRRPVAAAALPRPWSTTAWAPFDPDPKRCVEALRRAADEVRAGRNPLDEGGLVAVLATPRAAAGPRAHRRADEPARGPRRRDHGPGRRRPDPQRRAVQPGAAPRRQQCQRAGHGCSRSSSASRPS